MIDPKILVIGLTLTLAGAAFATAQTGVTQAPVPQTRSASSAASERSDEGESQDSPSLGTPAITFDQAVRAAEAYAKSGAATEVKLEDENGTLVYAVVIGGAEFKIDASSGDVLRVEARESEGRDGGNHEAEGGADSENGAGSDSEAGD